MSPLKVRIAVIDEAQPLLDFLNAHRYDVGSINADRVVAGGWPPDMRFLCVALADVEALMTMSERMRSTWLGDPDMIALTNRVALMPLPLDTVLAVFLDVVAIEAPDGPAGRHG